MMGSIDRFERCCRLCAEEQDVTIMIFSQEAEAMLLQNKLNRYLLIEVEEDDKLPKNICIQCCTKLQTVCDFIDTARKAQEELLKRSIMLDQIIPNDCMISLVKNDVKHEYIPDNDKYTEMEISVDPMIVLQNSEETYSPSCDHGPVMEDVTFLHGLDTEDVTIKLIKRGNNSCDAGNELTIKTSDYTGYEDEKKDSEPKPFPCSKCSRRFCSELALKNHMWVHNCEIKGDNQYKCTSCLETFDYKFDLISHLKQHRASGECQLCGRMFRSERTYVAHMSVHLPTNKSYSCKICGRSYNTWGGLKTHSVTHSDERPYQCEICKKNFKRNQDLKFHMNQHTGEKPYKCPFCEKCFASSGNCYSHRSRMHPGKQPDGQVKRMTPLPKEKLSPRPIAPKPAASFKYQCHLCEHSFMKRDNFAYHMYQHTGEKPFCCSFCTEKFVTRRGLLIHHDNKHPGEERPLGLISKNSLFN